LSDLGERLGDALMAEKAMAELGKETNKE